MLLIICIIFGTHIALYFIRDIAKRGTLERQVKREADCLEIFLIYQGELSAGVAHYGVYILSPSEILRRASALFIQFNIL